MAIFEYLIIQRLVIGHSMGPIRTVHGSHSIATILFIFIFRFANCRNRRWPNRISATIFAIRNPMRNTGGVTGDISKLADNKFTGENEMLSSSWLTHKYWVKTNLPFMPVAWGTVLGRKMCLSSTISCFQETTTTQNANLPNWYSFLIHETFVLEHLPWNNYDIHYS